MRFAVRPRPVVLLAVALAGAVLAAACGGEEAPTPLPTAPPIIREVVATPTPGATPTPIIQQVVATPTPGATPTPLVRQVVATPTPGPSPTPAVQVVQVTPTAIPVSTLGGLTRDAAPGLQFVANKPDYRQPPKRGGTTVAAFASASAGLDTTKSRSFTTMIQVSPVYNRLVRPQYEAEQELADVMISVVVPDLAERWQSTEGGKVWTFTLRRGVKWQTIPQDNKFYSAELRSLYGRELVASDVVYTYDLMKKNGRHPLQFGLVEKTEAVDNYTVRITLSKPWPGFLAGTTADNNNPILPPEVGKLDGDHTKRAVGTGAFIMTEHDPRGVTKFVKNPNYWRTGADGKPLPYLDGHEVHIVSDSAVQRAGLITGRFDWADQGGPETARELRQFTRDAPNVAVYEIAPKWGIFQIGMRTDIAPFNDVRVRQALNLAIDWTKLIDQIDGGRAVQLPAFNWPMAFDTMPEQSELGEYFQVNKERARQLLADAGLASGFSTKFVVFPYGAVIPKYALAIKEELKDVGINVDVQVLGAAQIGTYYAQTILRPLTYECCLAVTIAATGGDDWIFFKPYRSDDPGNLWGVDNPEINTLVDDIRVLADGPERRAKAKRVWEIFSQNLWHISLPQQFGFREMNKRVINYMPSWNGDWPHQGGWSSEILWINK